MAQSWRQLLSVAIIAAASAEDVNATNANATDANATTAPTASPAPTTSFAPTLSPTYVVDLAASHDDDGDDFNATAFIWILIVCLLLAVVIVAGLLKLKKHRTTQLAHAAVGRTSKLVENSSIDPNAIL